MTVRRASTPGLRALAARWYSAGTAPPRVSGSGCWAALGPGRRELAELSVSQDAAGQHLLVYGYGQHPHRIAEMNLSTGHLASVTVAQPPLGSPFSSDAW